jgi:hypothetical protein
MVPSDDSDSTPTDQSQCDEEKPSCKKCEGYGTPCSYLQTHALKTGIQTTSTISTPPAGPTIQSMLCPEPPSSTPSPLPTYNPNADPSAFTMLDMELIHFFLTESADQFKGYYLPKMFKTAIMQISFQYPFLLHEMLSLAALHIAHSQPERKSYYLLAADSHTTTGLSLFQQEIRRGVNETNCHACFAFSTMLFTQAWASQDLSKPNYLFFPPTEGTAEGQVQWVKLIRGTHTILEGKWGILAQGPLAGLFTRWDALDENRDDPITEEEEWQLRNVREAWIVSARTQEEKNILDGALRKLQRVMSMLSNHQDIGKHPIIMSWFSTISDEYIKMLEQRTPEAVLIAIYYCVPLRLLDTAWWMKGKARNLLETLLGVLGEGWTRWTKWPLEKVMEEDMLLGKSPDSINTL